MERSLSRARSETTWEGRVPALIGLMLLAALVLAAPAAQAEPLYVVSDPADGSVVDEAPAQVTITFSEPVEGVIKIKDECGRRLDAADTASLGNQATVTIKEPIGGPYLVRFEVSGLTGEAVGGFAFAVREGKTCHELLGHVGGGEGGGGGGGDHKGHGGGGSKDGSGGGGKGHSGHDTGSTVDHSGHTVGDTGSTVDHSGHTVGGNASSIGKDAKDPFDIKPNQPDDPSDESAEDPPTEQIELVFGGSDELPPIDTQALVIAFALTTGLGFLGGYMLRASSGRRSG